MNWSKQPSSLVFPWPVSAFLYFFMHLSFSEIKHFNVYKKSYIFLKSKLMMEHCAYNKIFFCPFLINKNIKLTQCALVLMIKRRNQPSRLQIQERMDVESYVFVVSNGIQLVRSDWSAVIRDQRSEE